MRANSKMLTHLYSGSPNPWVCFGLLFCLADCNSCHQCTDAMRAISHTHTHTLLNVFYALVFFIEEDHLVSVALSHPAGLTICCVLQLLLNQRSPVNSDLSVGRLLLLQLLLYRLSNSRQYHTQKGVFTCHFMLLLAIQSSVFIKRN